jgi:hypothetical protein
MDRLYWVEGVLDFVLNAGARPVATRSAQKAPLFALSPLTPSQGLVTSSFPARAYGTRAWRTVF